MLEYKGYVGEVVHDVKSGVLHASVINSGPYPVATAESLDESGISREFQISIDVYLEGCAELGIDPVVPSDMPMKTSAT